jgi:hypothetical protein
MKSVIPGVHRQPHSPTLTLAPTLLQNEAELRFSGLYIMPEE